MRDVWLLAVVLGVAVAAGMWKSGPTPTAKAEMPAAMSAMGDSAPVAAEGDGCCPTDPAAAAKHDCGEHEGEACEEHGEGGAAEAKPLELTPEQMSSGVCPMGDAPAEAPAAATTADPHAGHEGHEGH